MAVCLSGVAGGWGLRAVTGTKSTDNPGRGAVAGQLQPRAPVEANAAGGNVDEIAPASVTLPPVADVIAASGGELRRLLVRFLSMATVEDIEELLTASQSTNRFFTGLRTYQDLIFRRAVELDATGFVLWMKDAESMANSRDHTLQRVYIAWQRIDPDSAVAASATESAIVRRGVLQALAETDPDRALELMRAEAEGKDESWQRWIDSIEAGRIIKLADENIELALEEAMANLSDNYRSIALNKIVEPWARKDPSAAWLWLERIVDDESPESSELKRAIIERFAELDPAGAWELVEGNEKLQVYSGNIVGIWAKTDLVGAVDAAIAAKRQTSIYSVMEGAGLEQVEALYACA